jgi:oxygen-independent coproporphyrinogen-3 oxidase
LEAGAEVALEANPENLNRAYLEELAAGGWNRLSLGAQSLDESVLRFLGRRHGPGRVLECVEMAREAGFTNISMDLIYAVPGQTTDSWRETLRGAVGSGVPHVSAYTLTIEAETVFGKRAAQGKLIPLSDDSQAEYMEIAAEELAAGGLTRYEVSNWAKEEFACRHNQNYWRGGDYIAAGCGAHGHKAGHRWWNERDARRYVESVFEHGSAIAGEEFLTVEERLEERLALALRSMEGMDLETVGGELGVDVAAVLKAAIDEAVENGWIEREGSRIRPRPENLVLADGIAGRMVARMR